jgi:glutamate racemase
LKPIREGWFFYFIIMSIKSKPIGIFDSGLGGLTLAKAISLVLPNEELIYFGDTLHAPNGDRSKETIIENSTRVIEFLLEQQCKVIIIACYTISANAFATLINIVGNKVKLLNAIDPLVEYITDTNYKNIGVIGTRSTIESNVIDDKISKINKGMIVSSMATPLLVPMIEEGYIFDEISSVIIRDYLSKHDLKDIEALILACTHYPVLKNQLNKYYNFEVDIIDSVKILTNMLSKILREEGLLNDSSEKKSNKFFVSDLTLHQKVIAKMFFEKEVSLEIMNLWK